MRCANKLHIGTQRTKRVHVHDMSCMYKNMLITHNGILFVINIHFHMYTHARRAHSSWLLICCCYYWWSLCSSVPNELDLFCLFVHSLPGACIVAIDEIVSIQFVTLKRIRMRELWIFDMTPWPKEVSLANSVRYACAPKRIGWLISGFDSASNFLNARVQILLSYELLSSVCIHIIYMRRSRVTRPTPSTTTCDNPHNFGTKINSSRVALHSGYCVELLVCDPFVIGFFIFGQSNGDEHIVLRSMENASAVCVGVQHILGLVLYIYM